MAIAISVPVVVSPEAAARLAELDHRDPFDQMVEQVTKHIPGLLSIQVDLVPDYDEGGDPGVCILAQVDPHTGISQAGRQSWRTWKLATFSTDVWRHYSLLCVPAEVVHAG